MSENNEKFVLEDGRKAEKVVVDSKINDKESQRVIEIKAEETRPLKPQQRITEKMKSYMYERVTETLDQDTGNVVDTKVESFDCLTGEIKEEPKNSSKINSLGVVDELDGQQNSYDIKNILLVLVIAAQLAGLLYLLLWK
jgi:hypothetical protein